jgi:uncharacterized membrane protein
MELIYSLHNGLETIAFLLKSVLEVISILCVAMGVIASLNMGAGLIRRSRPFVHSIAAVRLKFGSWLALALEFQLGADIVATTVNPTLQTLGELGLLAVIRTFLNYFLHKELEAAAQHVKDATQGNEADEA